MVKTMPSPLLAAATQFAAALDAEDYGALQGLLSVDCEYVASSGVLVGPEAIIASYRKASAWAKANIDSVTYASSVRVADGDLAIVTFVDLLEGSGLRHSYSCEQSVAIGADGEIRRIVHLEIPGQRDAVDSFLRQIGVATARWDWLMTLPPKSG